jgi:hypothetical protein
MYPGRWSWRWSGDRPSKVVACRVELVTVVYKLPPGNLQHFSGRKDLETKNAFTDESRRGSDSLLQHDKSSSTKEASVHRTNMYHACDHQKHLYLLSHVCLSALIHWFQLCDQHEPQRPFGKTWLCTFCVLLATILWYCTLQPVLIFANGHRERFFRFGASSDSRELSWCIHYKNLLHSRPCRIMRGFFPTPTSSDRVETIRAEKKPFDELTRIVELASISRNFPCVYWPF